MKTLHPLTWMLIGLSLLAASIASSNFLVNLVVIAVLAFCSASRSGRRAHAFTVALKLGIVFALSRMLFGLIVGPSANSGQVLFFLPEIVLDQYTRLGGPYDMAKLTSSIQAATLVIVVWLVIGLWWQAASARQWIQTCHALWGRAGELCAPFFSIGEAVVGRRDQPRRSLVGVVERVNQSISINRVIEPVAEPVASRAAIAAVVSALMGVSAVLLVQVGGLNLKITGVDFQIKSLGIASCILLLWVLARLSLSRTTIRADLRGWDGIAIAGSALVALAVVIAPFTGDIDTFRPGLGDWPALPKFLVGSLLLSVALWIVSDQMIRRR